MFKAKIHVTLKKVILDPQGTAVQKALLFMGYAGVEDVRLGKYVEVRINSLDPEAVQKQVQEMCERLLVNPVIEEFTFEIEKL
jgi:phosphoribosylformylglycinamidine synthase